MTSDKTKGLPSVVIVGGGFGGLYAARGLADAPVGVTIIDKHNYHLFRPMLYQVATGLLSADEIAAPIRSILRKQKNVEVLMAEVVGVDPENQVVETVDGSSLHYDYLVLATGIHYNYFGHDDWKELAPGLDSVDDADRIRGKILSAFETAERKAAEPGADPQLLEDLLTFVLVGAGTAGVEMAGTIAEMARLALTGDFRHIDPRSAHILLFEAAPRILPSYPQKLSDRAREHLQQIGVDVRTNAKVENVDADGVVVNGQRIGSRTVLWSAGVVASPAGLWLGAETDRPGDRHIGVANVAGNPGRATVTYITTGNGTNIEPHWSAVDKYLVYQHTDTRNSADFYSIESKANAKPVRLSDSMPAGIDKAQFVEPQFVHFPGADGKSVPGWLFVPKNLDRTKKHQAIIWIHGDGVNQNYDGWHVQRNYAVY